MYVMPRRNLAQTTEGHRDEPDFEILLQALRTNGFGTPPF